VTTVPLTTEDLMTDSEIDPASWVQGDEGWKTYILNSEGDFEPIYEATDEGHALFLLRLAQMWQWLQDNPDVMQATEDVLSGVASPEVREWAEYMYMRRNKGDWMLPIGEEEIAERDRQIRHTPRMAQRLLFGYKLAVNGLRESERRAYQTMAELKRLQHRLASDFRLSGHNKNSDLYQYWKHVLRVEDVLEGKVVDENDGLWVVEGDE